VRPGRLDLDEVKYVTRDFHTKNKKSQLREGDILFVRVGENRGDCCVVPSGVGDLNCANIVFARPQKPLGAFLGFYFRSPTGQHQLRSISTGSAQGVLNTGAIAALEVPIPSEIEAEAIARILGTLDDKIELNRRMNATLEAMARALFQSWFVDAVPDESALPEGWELSTIGVEAKVVGGSTPSTKSPEFWDNGEFHWVTPKDFSSLQSKVLIGSSRKVTQSGLDQITSGLLPENTVLLSSRAPVGYLALTKIKTAINQGFIAMICDKRLSPEYVMLWADSIMDKIKQAASGTTFAEISKATFRPFPIIVPSAKRLSEFTTIVRAFYDRIAANERQSVTLTETRDALLPRLLSGELRTEEAANAG